MTNELIPRKGNYRQLKALETIFLKEGGMREKMTQMRMAARRNEG